MIHSISPWREEPFVKVSCEAVQESQLVEMFFGDEATSKESANDEEGNSSRSGLIEQAAGGTLFLRNLVGLPRWMQEQLLQAAQAGRFFRKGGVKPIPFRARIAASTLCDPARSVKEGRLLDELHFYLGAHSLVIPPLRDRREDIRPLISALVQEASRDPSLSVRGPAPTFSEESLQLLEAHNWPGNVCELSNVVRRVFVFISEPEVTADHVAEMLPVLPGSDTITVPFGGNLKEIERAIVAEVIHRARGNKSAAARSLGLHRKTLYRIIEQGVGVPNQRAGG
jgi:DNA-binding NtrC family response regulator